MYEKNEVIAGIILITLAILLGWYFSNDITTIYY